MRCGCEATRIAHSVLFHDWLVKISPDEVRAVEEWFKTHNTLPEELKK